ncbi:Interferon-related developmental regulator 1 [Zancudomyces culisetae]|uniref:Interferon-related developmental regulator 1 n=1 Tax=Zancudomyces culisetae TaxID=1213189 RepID=A0A1R1PY97_ZANCU|nr:Interferon-related developmental regulator 1 [Zancudomyces culisetae]|eukprot:OMH85898.1 Interferon-related developmental regulator 1 [Zancudomyces culisetae]
MASSGGDYLKAALGKYSNSGEIAALGKGANDNDSDNEENRAKTSPKSQRAASSSKQGSKAPTPAPSGRRSRGNSRAPSRIQSRANSRDKNMKNIEEGMNSLDIGFDETIRERVGMASLDTEEGDDYDPSGQYARATDQIGQFSTEQLSGAIDALIDKIAEKRSSSKEAGLQGLCSIMAHKYIGESQEGNKLSILETFKRSLKFYKSDKEALLAARGIALWFLQFGLDDDSMYPEVSEFLVKMISETSNAVLKAQLVHSLAFSTFVSCVDTRDTIDVLKICSKQFSHWQSGELTYVSLSAYGLLLAQVADKNIELAKEIFEGDYAVHLNLLNSENVDVRISSSENIALGYEIIRSQYKKSKFYNHKDLVETLEEMARTSTKKQAKRDKTQQRSALRQVVSFISEGIAPETKLNFMNKYVVIDTWKKTCCLNAFRYTLTSGLHTQFLENPLVQEIFDTPFDTSNSTSLASEKMVVDSRSELAKSRSKNKNKQRDNKERFISSTFDDEDH